MTGSANLEAAMRAYRSLLRGDTADLAGLLDPEVRWHGGDPTAEGACRNRDEVLAFAARAILRGRVVEAVEAAEGGDRVVLLLRRSGCEGAESLVANVVTFRDGRIVELVHRPDAAAALAELGSAPPG